MLQYNYRLNLFKYNLKTRYFVQKENKIYVQLQTFPITGRFSV